MSKIGLNILMKDNLCAISLKHLLLNLFNIDAQILDIKHISATNFSDTTDLFITDDKVFSAFPDFFMTRKNRLAIVSDYGNSKDGSLFLINRHASEKEIVSELSNFVTHSTQRIQTANELSQREIEVLCEVASGLTNKEIAERLNISINTVLTHRKNITSKLGIKSVSALSVFAIMNGYISPKH